MQNATGDRKFKNMFEPTLINEKTAKYGKQNVDFLKMKKLIYRRSKNKEIMRKKFNFISY